MRTPGPLALGHSFIIEVVLILICTGGDYFGILGIDVNDVVISAKRWLVSESSSDTIYESTIHPFSIQLGRCHVASQLWRRAPSDSPIAERNRRATWRKKSHSIVNSTPPSQIGNAYCTLKCRNYLLPLVWDVLCHLRSSCCFAVTTDHSRLLTPLLNVLHCTNLRVLLSMKRPAAAVS